ncbi:MAG TPA: Asp-tRNA(Asn)/Glu-tRNA(Gln) amidotransferase subunit GatC [Candidatus Paceibacterota bacterium]|nr:Asp-tRNA(Asn)/Glu-tRNA(Gln) amidotransferase subunit GatC [Candidatus Paceibacterota bacterium]
MLSKEEGEKLVQLARVGLDPAELDLVLASMASTLSYVSEIQEVVTEAEPVPVAGVHRNVFREDADPYDGGAFTPAIIANAPETEDGYFKVEQVL